MCGIAGFLGTDLGTARSEAIARAMLATLRHRGPDQFGIYTHAALGQRVVLGHSRLSIIDLSGGQQPISNEDNTLWIVFNGEVFNFPELRESLKKQGHRFKTQSDTEVFLHLYEQYGAESLEKINGQFAVAIWDETKHELFVARDRCGILPFFYTETDRGVVFASEIKAIFAHPTIQRELDPLGIEQTLCYWSPVGPRTAFAGIKSLPPGHFAKFNFAGSSSIQRYWQMKFPVAGAEPIRGTDDAVDELSHLLIDATRIRLRADVTVGAYLSGGLDSSAVTALARNEIGEQLETFSLAFSNADFDESEFQLLMSQHLGTRHHTVKCTHDDIANVFSATIWHTETPILRTAPAPLFLLSQLAQSHGIKVVLTGEGADEFLGGYNIFKEAKIRRFWSRFPNSNWRHVLLGKLYPYIRTLSTVGAAYQRAFFGQGLDQSEHLTFSHHIRWRNTQRLRGLLSRAFQERSSESSARSENNRQDATFGNDPALDWPVRADDWSPLARAQYVEATLFLPEYLLSSQGDRMLMAHGVEGRFPFLDPRVIDFACQLAPRLKIHGLNEKFVLKRAMRGVLPEIIWNRPKRPYRAPIADSFLTHSAVRPWVAELLSESNLRSAGVFEPRAVAGMINKFSGSKTLSETDNMAFVGVISVQLLHQQFVADCRPSLSLNSLDDVKVVHR